MPAAGAPPDQADIAATDREGVFLLPGLPRRPLRINLNKHGFLFQREDLPADRDEVQWTYRLEPDSSVKSEPAPRLDDPIPAGLRERLTFLDLEASAPTRWPTGRAGRGTT